MEHNIESSCNLWFEQNYYSHHGWHFTNINPVTHNLCMAMGVDCNLCEPVYPQGTIIYFNDMNNPTFDNATIYVEGIRDSVGFIFDTDGMMIFTDHNTDRLGDDKPDCELNILSYIGQHFGYPYCHSLGTGDPYKRDAGNVDVFIDPTYGEDRC